MRYYVAVFLTKYPDNPANPPTNPPKMVVTISNKIPLGREKISAILLDIEPWELICRYNPYKNHNKAMARKPVKKDCNEVVGRQAAIIKGIKATVHQGVKNCSRAVTMKIMTKFIAYFFFRVIREVRCWFC